MNIPYNLRSDVDSKLKGLLRRDMFSDHRQCLEKHKRQRVLYRSCNGEEEVVNKETINFSPLGTEYYMDELNGKTHKLNRVTGECSCQNTSCNMGWKTLLPAIISQLLLSSCVSCVESIITLGVPIVYDCLREAWEWIIDLVDEVIEFVEHETKPLVLTYLPKSKVIALEDATTQKIVWKQIPTTIRSEAINIKSAKKKTNDIRSYYFSREKLSPCCGSL